MVTGQQCEYVGSGGCAAASPGLWWQVERVLGLVQVDDDEA
nr:hypothetical protein [Kribbella capetownensis]